MADCHMPSIQIEHIFHAGYTTIALLAHGIHDESKMEEFVEHLSVIPDGETFQTFSPQSAAIRRVLKECIAKCVLSRRDTPIDAPTAPPTKTRLSVADVKALKTEFCQNYPGELLLPGTMPSLSFLCTLKDAIDTNNFTWIPWKSRTSEADEQAFAEHRRPRNDRQLLRSLLTEGDSVLNEQPEAVINHQAPTEVVLAKFETFYLLLWLCWALRTWLWQNHEISTCVPHRCRKFWMLTGLHGPLSQTCYMSRSGHSMMSSMKWPSAGRFFIPPWHLVLVRYNNRSRIRPSADLIFQSRFPRSPRPPAQVTTHPNSRSLTPRN